MFCYIVRAILPHLFFLPDHRFNSVETMRACNVQDLHRFTRPSCYAVYSMRY